MKGLDLSRQYFERFGKEMLDKQFPDLLPHLAGGLVGEGSECLGFDDAYSQDHDFGPGFCLWLPESYYQSHGPSLQAAYDQLPSAFGGFSGRKETKTADKRVGVFSIEGFYSKYTNTSHGPTDSVQWLRIPMHYLRVATNGEVFFDHKGLFSEIRASLLAYYPADVVRKKLAAQTAFMAQAGQYNYPRAIKRRDFGAAYLSCGHFVKATTLVLFLLNKRYAPFYKWVFRDAESFQEGREVVRKLQDLMSLPDQAGPAGERKINLIEDICIMVIEILRAQGYSACRDTFLQGHAEAIMRDIEDVRLRTLPLTFDVE